MKIVSIILAIIAVFLIGFNISNINTDNPFEKDSAIAIIEILASIIAILILAIFNISKLIEKKVNK